MAVPPAARRWLPANGESTDDRGPDRRVRSGPAQGRRPSRRRAGSGEDSTRSSNESNSWYTSGVMESLMPLPNKAAIVTGGDSGIGHAISVELGRQGAAVTVNYHRNEAAASATV